MIGTGLASEAYCSMGGMALQFFVIVGRILHSGLHRSTVTSNLFYSGSLLDYSGGKQSYIFATFVIVG